MFYTDATWFVSCDWCCTKFWAVPPSQCDAWQSVRASSTVLVLSGVLEKHSKQAGKTKYYANLYSWNPSSCLSKLLWSVNVHYWLTSSSVLRGVVFSGACIRSLKVSVMQMCIPAIIIHIIEITDTDGKS